MESGGGRYGAPAFYLCLEWCVDLVFGWRFAIANVCFAETAASAFACGFILSMILRQVSERGSRAEWQLTEYASAKADRC